MTALTAHDVTVVVCTYSMRRWDDLVLSMESVRRQTATPRRCLVVTDHADDVADAITARFPDAEVVANTRAQGLSGARNTALEHVDTPVVAFLDDDAVARPDWLAHLVAPFSDPAVLGVGGRLVPRWDTARPDWFPEEFDWVVGCTHRGSRVDPGPIRNPIGANMAFRTDLIRAAGGFEQALGRVGTRPVGAEETEASIRIAQHNPGGVFWFAPCAVVDHRVPADRGTWAYFRSRCYAEGLSKAHVRRLSHERLDTETSYATRVLPRAVARDLTGAVRGERGGLGRAAAIVAGLGVTAVGYVVGLGAGRARITHHNERPT